MIKPANEPALGRRFFNNWNCIALVLGTGIFGAFWFSPLLSYHTFMGDDLLVLSKVNSGNEITFWNSLTQPLYGKYRPVFAALQYVEFNVFKSNFHAYVCFNMLFEFLNVIIMAHIAWRVSRKRWFAAMAAALMMSTSRFNYYFIVQAVGFLEGLALFFLLMLIEAVMDAYERHNKRMLLWAAFWFNMLIYTHERYLAIAGFLALAIILAPQALNFKSRLERYAFAAIPIAAAFANYFIKAAIIRVPFFTGTGSAPLSFEVRRIAKFVLTGFANMIGFNVGPDYLAGLDFRQAGVAGYLIGIFGAVSITALIILYVVERRRVVARRAAELWNGILIICLLSSLILCASVTFRQEFRWLYAPYAVVIMGVAYLYGRLNKFHAAGSAALLSIALGACGGDLYYRQYLGNVFFIYSLKLSDSVKTKIVDEYRASLGNHEVYLNLNGREDVRNFILLEDAFFKVYAPKSKVRINYVHSEDEVQKLRPRAGSSLFFEVRGGEIVDTNERMRAMLFAPSDTPRKD